MLSSLFGDLPPRRLPATATPAPTSGAASGQASAALTASVADNVDVVVDDAPADAIRQHFASHRQDLQQASPMLTLLDPSRLWAPQVLQALAAAGGQPLQRLNLRARTTLRTLAVIERALVPRRDAATLRVYHADLRDGAAGGGVAADQIHAALAEGSQLTAVIVGAMQPHALLALLRSLVDAAQQPGWRCPRLVFLLPPGASALAQRIQAQRWPRSVTVRVLAEPPGSPASLWNRVLEAWETAQDAVDRPAAGTPAPDLPPRHVAPPSDHAHGSGLPLVVLNRLLLPLARSEGLLACAVVDLDSGDLQASQLGDAAGFDLGAVAGAMCAARLAHQAVAPDGEPPEEVLVTTGTRQTLLRRLPGPAPLGFVAVLDRRHANLTLLRFKLLDAERILA